MEQRAAAVGLSVNGEDRAFHGPADTPLLWVLREAFGLKGVKYGCGTGVCGACVVLVKGEPRHACTLAVADAAGTAVTTIEALAREPGRPLVQAWIAEQVPQCGYCRPAQLLTASWLLRGHPDPSDAQIDDAMSHVLCRCGTYPRIRRVEPRRHPGGVGEPGGAAGRACGGERAFRRHRQAYPAPASAMRIRPLNDRVVVKPLEELAWTAGGRTCERSGEGPLPEKTPSTLSHAWLPHDPRPGRRHPNG